MKKSVIIFLFLIILLVLPLVLAQEQSQTYSGFDRFADNVKMFFSSGDSKVKLALEIREKEIDLAIINSQNQNEKEAIKNLERAHKKLQFVGEKISLDVADEIKENSNQLVNKIENEEDLSENFEVYVLEEKKIQLASELTKEIFEMCKELAKEDYTAMLQEEQCNPKTAPKELQEELKELKKLQEELFVKLMFDIRSCIDDPGTCNCEDVSDINERAKCEKMIALAVKCEYKDDQEACGQIKSLQPPAESFVPDFLMNLFKEREDMIDYNIQKSNVPPECYNENTKPECEQYMYMKETRAKCWKDGKFNYDECGGPENKEPTMQESIPQCFDENDNFLEEKCGKITIVRNEEGLINYLIEKEIENIIDEFETKAEEHLMEIRSGWMMVENKWVIDEGQNQAENKVREIKKEMNQVDNDIQGWVVDHPAMEVDGDDGLTWQIKTEIGNSDNGLKPEIKTDVSGNNGNNGLTTEVKTNNAGEGIEEDNVVEGEDTEENVIEGNDGSDSEDTNEVVEGDGGEGDYAEGTTAEGEDDGEQEDTSEGDEETATS